MKKRKHKIKSEHFLIGTIVVSVFLMLGIGYALLSQTLQINGTANITSKWKILFTSAEEKEMNNATTQLKEITDDTTLTLNVELTQPGATATYDVVVANQGDLDAVLSKIEGVEETNNSDPLPIKVHLENIAEGDSLLKSEEKTFQVIVEWDSSVDFNETNMTKEIEITLTYEQSDGGVPVVPTPGDDTVNMGGQTVALVSSGDGLYEDQYENGRYIYRGQSPNNHIMFANTRWRIIAKEADGTYKIVSDWGLVDAFGEGVIFDEAGYRSYENNTYCTDLQRNLGCGVYGKVSGTYQSPDGKLSGTVTEDSTVADFLNTTAYGMLDDTAKSQIQMHDYYIGPVQFYGDDRTQDSLAKNIAGEKLSIWNGNIGLPNVSDVVKASLDPTCTSASASALLPGSYDSTSSCSSYFTSWPRGSWSINVIYFGNENSFAVWTFGDVEYHPVDDSVKYGAFDLDAPVSWGPGDAHPVVFLKSNIQFTSGDGSKEQPFQIG